MVSVGRCSCTHIKGHNQLVEVQHWTLHSAGRLASNVARFVSDWKRLEQYDCSCLCQPRAADTDGTRTSSSQILEIDFFDHCAKSHRFDAWQTEGNHQKQRRNCSVLILSLYIHCPEVTLSSHHYAIFGCCNIIEYYNCCWTALYNIFLK